MSPTSPPIPAGTTPAERRARRLLAAYPWRVRAEQGEEIVGTVLDALPPGATRLPWRAQVDLVEGGLRVRRRRRPPWPTVLAYSLGFRIDARWIWWVFDDLENPDYVRDKRRRMVLLWVVLMGATAVVFRDPMAALYGTGGLVGALVTIPRDRERRRARHGLVAGGSDPLQVWVEGRRPARLPNLGIAVLALWIGGAALLGAATTVAASIHQDPTAAPESVAADFEVTVHPVASAPLLPAVLGGTVVGLFVLASGLAALRRSRGRRSAGPTNRVVTSPLAGTGAVVALLVTGGVALPLRWQWVSGTVAPVAAFALAPALALVLVGGAAALVGRRRGAPVGLWDLATRLGPHAGSAPRPRWLVDHTPSGPPV